MIEEASDLLQRCLLFFLILSPLAASCDDPLVPVICSDEYVYGLYIEISDAGTGDAVGEEASILVTDGSYEETPTAVRLPDKVVAYAAGERPGNYDISVTLDGYERWDTTGVDVSANRCHVITVIVPAALIRGR